LSPELYLAYIYLCLTLHDGVRLPANQEIAKPSGLMTSPRLNMQEDRFCPPSQLHQISALSGASSRGGRRNFL